MLSLINTFIHDSVEETSYNSVKDLNLRLKIYQARFKLKKAFKNSKHKQKTACGKTCNKYSKQKKTLQYGAEFKKWKITRKLAIDANTVNTQD